MIHFVKTELREYDVKFTPEYKNKNKKGFTCF